MAANAGNSTEEADKPGVLVMHVGNEADIEAMCADATGRDKYLQNLEEMKNATSETYNATELERHTATLERFLADIYGADSDDEDKSDTASDAEIKPYAVNPAEMQTITTCCVGLLRALGINVMSMRVQECVVYKRNVYRVTTDYSDDVLANDDALIAAEKLLHRVREMLLMRGQVAYFNHRAPAR